MPEDSRYRLARGSKATAKWRLIEPYIEGDILDIGFAGQTPATIADLEARDGWLHPLIEDRADSCLGIDIDEQAVTIAQAAGYDAKVADAQAFDLDRRFDTILALNVIEHLSEPGAMLECAREHLRPDGRIVVTTPRPWTVWTFARALRNRGKVEPVAEHTMWFCRSTLQSLFERRGYAVLEADSWDHYRDADHSLGQAILAAGRALAALPGLDWLDDHQQLVVGRPVA